MELKVFLSICSESLMDTVNLQTEKVTFFNLFLTMEISPHKNDFQGQVLHETHFREYCVRGAYPRICSPADFVHTY